MKLWAHQARGIAAIRSALQGGSRRVLAVAPTGSGKGTMAASLLADVAAERKPGLFVVHRREIVIDIVKRLKAIGVSAGPILSGEREDRGALIQVASLQTMLSTGRVPSVKFAVFDEAHHYAADEWSAFFKRYSRVPVVGFTATPQRSDGRPLGDAFQQLIVVATYAELIRTGHIVDCGVLRPKKALGIDLAQDPVAAYLKYANGRAAFVFARRVAVAHELVERFRKAGIAAACVEAHTAKSERDDTMARLRDGSLTVVTNVFALTEGTDVPRVDTIVLARPCDHASTYVQMCGRALRSHKGTQQALLLDLTGISNKHGMPTAERSYTLDGTGMGEAPEHAGGGGAHEEKESKILGLDMVPVGKQIVVSPETDAKRARWEEIVGSHGSVSEAVKKYGEEFGERPPWARMLPNTIKQAELTRLQSMTGPYQKLATIRYQELFGEMP